MLYNILYVKESIPIKSLRYFSTISTLDQISLDQIWWAISPPTSMLKASSLVLPKSQEIRWSSLLVHVFALFSLTSSTISLMGRLPVMRWRDQMVVIILPCLCTFLSSIINYFLNGLIIIHEMMKYSLAT